ncbi:MAG: hypothetical protein AUG43_05530 [Actinobacteria bacterium 13_1_20CM_3_68_10]|nr:MAG: hypothetical protein AUG43_05530 [Actinobacteria bacterium 13_1_20CM_3_68_10]
MDSREDVRRECEKLGEPVVQARLESAPPRRRVRGTRTHRAGSEGRGGIRERGTSGCRRGSVRRAMDDRGCARSRGGGDRFVGETLVSGK